MLSLREFSIHNNNIDSKAANDIEAALYRKTKLKKSYLQDNNLETTGAARIAKAYEGLHRLYFK